jgi:hypothetical protein
MALTLALLVTESTLDSAKSLEQWITLEYAPGEGHLLAEAVT